MPGTVIHKLTVPRRPIFTVSPSRFTLVGSPIKIMSGRMPRSVIHSISAGVPKVAGPSSSPVRMKLTVPRCSATWAQADAKAATPPFMSTAPRP
jgi:hypothetical protein